MSYVEKPGQVTVTTDTPVPRGVAVGLSAGFATPTAPAAAAPAPPPPAPPPPPPAPPGTPAPGLDVSQQSAWDQLMATLASYGFSGTDLTDLGDFVKTELINGTSDAKINTDLMQTKEFANRFPAIIARQKAGLPPINPAQYIALEDQYAQLERSAGLPLNFTDQSHYDSLIANDVSASEYSSRIQNGYVAMAKSAPEAMQALQDYYGINQGTMAAYFLDPAKALPLIEQQAQAAIIGGAGIRTGFGEPTAAQAMRLAQLGITESAAQTGFSDLTHAAQLTGTLPGQAQQALSTDQLLGSEFEGDQATKDLLQRRADEQKANFATSGAFGSTAAGVTGLSQVVR
jgi:hypothetical protein